MMRFAALNRQESSGDSLAVSSGGKRGKPTREAQVWTSTCARGAAGMDVVTFLRACHVTIGVCLPASIPCCNGEAPGRKAGGITDVIL